MREPTLAARLGRLKKKTSWSWERLGREFHRVMGGSGPSFTTMFRYARRPPRRRNPIVEGYIREACQRIEQDLNRSDSLPRKQPRTTRRRAAGGEVFNRLAEKGGDVFSCFRLRPSPRLEYVSPSVEGLTGYSPQEYYRDPDLAFRIVHPEDRPAVHETVAGRNLSVVPRTIRLLHKDGREVVAERITVPVLDGRSRVVALETITRRVRLRAKEDPADRLRAALIESSPDAVITSGPGGEITSWNPAAEDLFGYRAEEVIGQPTSILLPPEGLGQLLEMAELLQTGRTLNWTDVERLRKDGRRIRVSVSISPIRGKTGEVVGFAGFARPAGKEAPEATGNGNRTPEETDE